MPWSAHHSERSRKAERRFLERVHKLGGRPADGATWNGGGKPYQLTCAAGHPCAPAPSNVLRGQGLCRTCAGNDTDTAHQRWQATLTAAGATAAPNATWAGVDQPYPIICAEGHASAPRPHDVHAGTSLCRTCAGRDSDLVHARFLAAVQELGGTPDPDVTWNGVNQPYTLTCAAGHPCAPHPHKVLAGGGLCRRCARRDSDAAHARFLDRVRGLGGQPAPDAQWRGVHQPYALTCAAGHTCAPHPSTVRDGGSMCRTCAGRDSATVHATFLRQLADHGARPAPGATWQGSGTPYPVICAAGHRSAPHPNRVQQGGGVCGQCRAAHDRVYLLHHPEADAIKVGITGLDRRVREHQARGYVLVAQWRHLEHQRCATVERVVVGTWRAKGQGAVSAAPKDGRTETAAAQNLQATLAQLTALLGDAVS